MPYVPLRSGQSTFVQDADQAEKLYQQEWGQAEPTVSKPQATAKPQAKSQPKPQAKPQQGQQRGFDLGGFIKQQGGQALQRAATGAATQFLAGPLAPFAQMLRGAQGIGNIQIPGTKTTLGKEAARAGAEGLRKSVNDPIAAIQQVGALTQGIDLGSALAGGGTPSVETNKALVEQRQKNATAAIEALQKTARDPEGFSYGIRPNVPVLGPLFSEDSEFVKKNIKPKTWGGQLAAGVFAAIGGDIGVSKLLKAPTMMAKTAQVGEKLSDIWTSKNINDGLKTVASFLIKDVVPDALQSSIYFAPSTPVTISKQLDDAQKLRSREERLIAAKAIRATSPAEFNYAIKQLENVAGGAAALGVLRGAFWVANKALNKATTGVPIEQALDEAVVENEPMVREALEVKGLANANEIREQRLGELTTQMYRKIEENVAEIAKGGRAGAEAYIQKRREILPETTKAVLELDGIPDVTPQLGQIETDISTVQKILGVKNVDELNAKNSMIQERLTGYEAAIAKDPDWINKSTGTGKRASKNNSKLRKATELSEQIKLLQDLYVQRSQFEQANLERLSKQAQLEKVTVDSMTASIGFRNSLNDARVLINALDTLDSQRVDLLGSRNKQLFAENRLDEMDFDYSIKGAYGEAYGELKDLLNAAEAAVITGNLNEDFMQMFVKQTDAIQNKIIENGGLAPIAPEIPQKFADAIPTEVAPEEGFVIPREPSPIVNTVPITKTDEGELVIDSDALASQSLQQTVETNEPATFITDEFNQANKALNIHQDPSESAETLIDFANNHQRRLLEVNEQIVDDLRNGTDLADDLTAIFSTNAQKYTNSLENAVAVKAVIDSLDERSAILPQQYAKAIRTLLTFTGHSAAARKLAAFTASEKFGKDVQKQLYKIIVPVQTFDDSAATALRDARDLRLISKGEEIEGKDIDLALRNAATSYTVFVANAKAINELFYGIGNSLNLFSQKMRIPLDYSSANPKDLFNQLIQHLDSYGDSAAFANSLSKSAKSAKEGIDEAYSGFFDKIKNGEELSDEEFEGFENLIDQIYQTNGNLEKLNNLELTRDAVLARLQTGSPISSLAMIASIPIQALPTQGIWVAAKIPSALLNAGYYNWLGQYSEASKYFKEARIASQTLLQLGNVWGEALEATYNRFIYAKSITDPTKAAEKAYEVNRGASLKREEAISQDLAKTEINIPFFNFVLEKAGDDDKIFDNINHARVFTKVFHDYFMSGEAWTKRSNFEKLISPATTGFRKLGIGTQSYYPAGENVNLTVFNQLSAAADEFSTSLFVNSGARSEAIVEVNDLIAGGKIDPENYADELNKRLNKKISDIYSPVKVGFDQKVIGYSVNEKRMLKLSQEVNLTKELTGASAVLADAVNSMRYSRSPVLNYIARDIAPIVMSPINGIEQAVKLSYGGELVTGAVDVARVGLSSAVKSLPQQVADQLPPNQKASIINFKSRYFSDDPAERVEAQGAFAIAAGLMALSAFLVRDGNQDIVGGLENSYRESEGAASQYTWNLWGKSLPYRFLPLIGSTLAFQATIRDFLEFAPEKDTSGLVALAVSSLATTILDTPAIAGFDKVIAALNSAQKGDASRMQKFLADSFAKAGDPYLNLRKTITEAFDPRKPATPISRYGSVKSYPRGKKVGQTITAEDALAGVQDSLFGLFGVASEYSGVGPITDIAVSIIKQDPQYRTASRKAIWYGPPGETAKANHAGIWYPAQTVLGRYWVFSNKMEDPVVREMNNNLIKGPSKAQFSSYGIGINDTELNTFNHYLNSEFEFYRNGKQYKGVYQYFKDLINSPIYKDLPAVDSPFKMGPFGVFQSADWDRANNERRSILQTEANILINEAREPFLKGNLPGQRYKASPETLQLVQQLQMTGGPR